MKMKIIDHVPKFIKPMILGMILFIVSGSFVMISAQTVEGYQLEAAQNNPEIKAAFQEYMAALQEEAQVSALPDPELAFGYFISPVETRLGPQRARVSVSQMFPWFGTLSSRSEIVRSEAKVRFEDFRELRNRVFFEVEQKLAEVNEIREKIRIAEDNLEILNALVEISLKKYETSQVTQIDVLRAQIEQEDLITELALLKSDLSVLLQEMKEVLGSRSSRDLTVEIIPDTSIIISDRNELLRQVMANNPSLLGLRYRQEVTENRADLARRQGGPSFGLGMDYIFTEERDDLTSLTDNGKDAWLAKVSIQIPLFRGKYNAQKKQADLKQRSAQFRAEAGENRMETALDAVLSDLADAERRFRLYDEKQIQRVDQALNIMMRSYASNETDFEEVLRMQRKMLTYQLSRSRALSDLQQAAARLDYLTGKHNAEITTEQTF